MSEPSSAPEVVALFEGENGARVVVYDETRPYGYANLFHARLRVVGSFGEGGERYERVLERLGVLDSELAVARRDMLENFKASALPYLLRPEFPRRLSEYRSRTRRKVIAFRGAPS
ncbi:MAG: hypothetical protein HY900_37210 [Deltaproteobacteria bacterium]|nr:hypothetical protein [Deltaproteobacteria bacterium]